MNVYIDRTETHPRSAPGDFCYVAKGDAERVLQFLPFRYDV
jgi:hypothetical protein